MTLQKSTAKLPEKIMPNLNKLYDQIRNLGADLNAKIGRLESTVVNQGFHAESELISMTNLKECVESAADVVSTASTTLGPEGSERASVEYGSDFGDVFKKDSNETMQRWMSSNTVYEYDDAEAPTLDPSEASTGDALTVYESDSDSDIEHELVKALFNNGKKRKEQGDLHGAERHLRNCLSRFPSTASYTSLTSSQSTLTTGVSKAELLELLTETYCLQGSWTQAKSTMKEKLAITERQTGKKSERFLWDSFRLCEVLMNTKDYTEAQLHGRQALRGFRKLREQGHTGYEKTLVLLVQICNEQGNLEDEEAYAALLGSHQANFETQQSTPAMDSDMKKDPASPSIKAQIQAYTLEPSAKSGPTQELDESTFIEPASTSKGEQTRLDRLTPISPLASQNDETPLSPSSSASADPWSPTAQAARFSLNCRSSEGVLDNTVTKTSFLKSVGGVPKTVSTHQDMPTIAKGVDAGNTSSSTKLLITLCQQELGRRPILMIGRGREGYNCIVFADETRKKEIAKVTDCLTKEEAGHAAAVKAYKTLVSLSTQSAADAPSASSRSREGLQNERSIPVSSRNDHIRPEDTYVDPPAYAPAEISSHLTSPTGFLQDIPEIMVSPTFNDAAIARPVPVVSGQNFPVRRAASDSRLPSYKISNNVSASTAVDSSTADPRRLHDAFTTNNIPAHRRAVSTSTRFPDWKAGDNRAILQHSGLAITIPTVKESHTPVDTRKRSNAQPSVTFDTIESFVERPDHSNPDPVTPSSKSFSLFPTSLAKTFSLQERRSKSDDPNLTKKKSLRFGLSSKRKSPTIATPKSEVTNELQASTSTSTCPICSTSLHGLSDDKAWSHVDSCLGGPSPPATDTTYELPASEPSFFAAELPALTPITDRACEPAPPVASNQSPSALSDLHRAFSKRDLSADKFEIEDGARTVPPTPMFPFSRFGMNPLQRQVLLLGDPQCGKTWLSKYVHRKDPMIGIAN